MKKIYLISFLGLALTPLLQQRISDIPPLNYSSHENQTPSGGGVITDDPMSSDSFSPNAPLNYYTYHLNAVNNAGNANSTSTVKLPAIIQFHQGLYSNDFTFAESKKLEEKLYSKEFIVFGDNNFRKDFHSNLKKSPSDSTAANCALDLRYPVFFSQSQIVKTDVDCQMGHGLSHDDNDPNTPYYSTFGLPLSSNEKAVNEYMVSRAAIFFQAILNNTVSAMVASGPSKFVECEDYRHSSGACSTAADYCNNNGDCH